MFSLDQPVPHFPGELVVLIHGLGGRRWWMAPLASRLRASGYRTVQFRYPSYRHRIVTHAENLVRFLRTLDYEDPVHVVAHSMGSVVLRAALSETTMANLGRFVFLAPPTCGTPVARFIANPLGRFFKTIAELSDHEESFVNQLPQRLDAYEVGIVAAKYDVLVPLAKTNMMGEQDRWVVATTHNLLPASATTAKAVISFLNDGRFDVDG